MKTITTKGDCHMCADDKVDNLVKVLKSEGKTIAQIRISTNEEIAELHEQTQKPAPQTFNHVKFLQYKLW